MSQIHVLGIDAAFANMGFAHAILTIHDRKVVAFDCMHLELVSTEAENRKQVRKSSDELRRAFQLKEAIIHNCAGKSFAFVEVPSGSQSASAARALGIAVGVLASCPIAMIEVSPMEVKDVVNGNRKAKVTKADVIDWAVKRWPAAPWKKSPMSKRRDKLTLDNEHCADALASIQAGIDSPDFQRLLTLSSHETSSSHYVRPASRRVPLD
jgi:Holliday junction resolvasome RuvABC endonuclease subunit